MSHEGFSIEKPSEPVVAGDDVLAAGGPTIEEFVARGYAARNYPPQGYAVVDSEGYRAFREYQADPESAEKHQAAATILGVAPGELTHGKVIPLKPGEGNRPPEAVSAANPLVDELGQPRARTDGAAENQALAEAHGIDLGTVPPVGDFEARRLQLTERRQNDPGSLTEEEAKELAHLEHLAGVEERRSGGDADGPSR